MAIIWAALEAAFKAPSRNRSGPEQLTPDQLQKLRSFQYMRDLQQILPRAPEAFLDNPNFVQKLSLKLRRMIE